MSKHSDLVNEIVHEGNCIPGCRLWTNPTSMAYVGKGQNIYNKKKERFIVIPNGVCMQFGLQEGSSDIVGFMVKPFKTIKGKECKVPVFVGIEVKVGKDRRGGKQIKFGNMLMMCGAIYGVARDVNDLYRILGENPQ